MLLIAFNNVINGMSELKLHTITLENVIHLQLITISIIITPTLHWQNNPHR